MAATATATMMTRGLAWALRLGLGAVFVGAGVLKLRDPTAFATDIANYQILPALAPFLAAVLPVTEILAGIALVVAWRAPWRRAAALAVGLMMLVFTGAAASVLARGIDVACGCFGGEGGTIDALTIARDVALVAAAGALVWLERAEA